MKILLVAATPFEIKALTDRLRPETVTPGRLYRFQAGQHEVHMLTPGIGILPTAYSLGKLLPGEAYDLAVNAGICGAYNREVPLGTVVVVTEEVMPEMGVDEEGVLVSVFETGLVPPDEFPFAKGKLVSLFNPPWESFRKLRQVSGNTILTMQTSPSGIRRLLDHAPADVETMEGAAFLYCCLASRIPCLQVRSVSNYAGERDMKKWNIRKALNNLDRALMELLEELCGEGFKP